MKINLLEKFIEIDAKKRNKVNERIALHNNPDIDEKTWSLPSMIKEVMNEKEVMTAINTLRERVKGKWQPHHFGRLELIPFGKVYYDIDTQRNVELKHVCRTIIANFDPRIIQPINVVYFRKQDIYVSWDGLQSGAAMYFLINHGFIEVDNWENWMIQAKVVESDLEVPWGIVSIPESIGLKAFLTLNQGRKEIDPYYIIRNETYAVRRYNSTMIEDVHSELIWALFEKYGMLPGPSEYSKHPLFINHISGIKKLTNHGKETFGLWGLEQTLKMLKKVSLNDDGINSSFYMVLHILFNLLEEQGIDVGTSATKFNTKRFGEFILETYGKKNSSHTFRERAVERLQRGRGPKADKVQWTDACGVPYIIDDYMKYCDKHGLVTGQLPEINNWSDFIK
jgi:hypothetical protein